MNNLNVKLLNVTNHEYNNLNYYLNDFWIKHEDPRMKWLPLISGGPWIVIFVSLLYVLFVTKIGPFLMRNRKPFDLRKLILHYNSILIGVNGFGFLICLWITNWAKKTLDCTEKPNINSKEEVLMIYLGFFYLISKILDFGDTIFFVLRKKYNQVTFLHIFHHSIMPIGCLIGLKFHPLLYSAFMPLVNAFIHTIMYSYYALACAGKEYKPYLFWKKHLTQAQMIQFVMIFFHALNSLINPNCKWPLYLALLEIGQALIFFFLFYSFYNKTYIQKFPILKKNFLKKTF